MLHLEYPLSTPTLRLTPFQRGDNYADTGGHRQIDVQQRPIQMSRAWPFNGSQLLNGGLLEPGKFGERQQKLLARADASVIGDSALINVGVTEDGTDFLNRSRNSHQILRPIFG